jgi:hypothetical protein
MQDFGVLEQDIVIARFMATCLESGFADVRLKPISYVIPEFDLELKHWEQCSGSGAETTQRAAHKMWRAIVELFGASKTDLLLEEVFAVDMIRLLKQPVEEHPVFVGYKAPVTRWQPPVFSAAIVVTEAPRRVDVRADAHQSEDSQHGQSAVAHVGHRRGFGRVRAGVQLLGADRKLIDRDYHRADLPTSAAPGDEFVVETTYGAEDPGALRLEDRSVMEGVTWFEPTGSQTAVHDLLVEGGV